jgi:hypothetical protein
MCSDVQTLWNSMECVMHNLCWSDLHFIEFGSFTCMFYMKTCLHSRHNLCFQVMALVWFKRVIFIRLLLMTNNFVSAFVKSATTMSQLWFSINPSKVGGSDIYIYIYIYIVRLGKGVWKTVITKIVLFGLHRSYHRTSFGKIHLSFSTMVNR